MGAGRPLRRTISAAIRRRLGQEPTRSEYGGKVRPVGAQRSQGIAQGFRQRRPVTDGDLGPSGDRYLWSATKPFPWHVRARNRRRNAVARAARKANR